MNQNSKIYVAGHKGLIGSAMCVRLQKAGYQNILTKTHAELELEDASAVEAFFDAEKPDYVVLAAGKVGGIVENKTYPADFITRNLAIQLNVLRAVHKTNVQKLILFASSCMYPRTCPQPMAEEALFSAPPEPTSMAYAVSKMAGMQLCLAYNQQYGHKRFIPVIPNSVFGPHDNFDPNMGHVLSVLIGRFHEAKATNAPNITLWGSGMPRREFIFSSDVADACLMLLEKESREVTYPLNLGTGQDLSIKDLAEKIAAVVGYKGEILWDTSKPDGAPRKLLDSTRIRECGWQPETNFEEGLRVTYEWFLKEKAA